MSLCFCLFPSSMIKPSLGGSTRSIYLGLACLSLSLHLLLAFFCLSVLQTACVLPTSSPASTPTRTNSQHSQSISHSSSSSPSSAASSSRKLPTIPRSEEHHPLSANTSSDATGTRKKRIGAGKGQRVKSLSKLEELFKHPLYNLPRPQLQGDDWLLRLKTNEHGSDGESEEEEREDAVLDESQW